MGALAVESTEEVVVLPCVGVESPAAGTSQHLLFLVFFVHALTGWVFFGQSAIVVVKVLHLVLELGVLVLLGLQHLVDFFLLFFVELVEVYLADGVEGNGRGDLLLNEVFVGVFAEPRMREDLFHTVDRTQTLLRVLAEQAF